MGLRLAILSAALLTAIMAIFGVSSVFLQRRNAYVAIRWDARRLVESLERTLRVQMLRGDSQLGEAVMRIARPDGDVAAVSLAGHTGRVRYATRPELVGAPLRIGGRTCTGRCHTARSGRRSFVLVDEQRTVASAFMPVHNGPQCARPACHPAVEAIPVLGLLAIEVSFRPVALAIRRHAWQMTGISAALIVATFVAVLLITRRLVGRPVARLLEATRAVGRGELTQPIAVGGGELGELAQAFNGMQQRLAASQRQLVMQEKLASVGRLSASLAHEINNPLSGILAFAEDLYEEAAEDDPHRADYRTIVDEALRCREIVRDLLDFGRPQPPRLQDLRLEEALARTVRLATRLTPFHQVRIETELDPSLPRLRADPGQLQQLFLNLLVNAAEAMPSGGALWIRAAAEGAGPARSVHLAFRDTGHGIPPELQAQVFDPFVSTKGGRASGLGLSICWSIVEQHGGRMTLESEEGRGTTVHVHLPAADAAAKETNDGS